MPRPITPPPAGHPLDQQESTNRPSPIIHSAVTLPTMLKLAGAAPEGPLLRTFDGVIHEGAICFHGGDHGEKLELVGREVMLSAEDVVAHLPSYFFDERRACPATTYYRSVHAWGTVERIDDRPGKAAVLQALMERLQPEGGHEPLTAESRLYAGVLDGLLVCRVRPVKLVGKAKLGQHRSAAVMARALEGLWRRGAPGDLAAIRIVRDAHPERPTPAFMLGPHGITFEVAPDAREVDAAVELLARQAGNENVDPTRLRTAHLASPAWIVAKDPEGTVVATARAVSDSTELTIVLDVAVRPDLRDHALDRALLTPLLDHPRTRGARQVLLRTREASSSRDELGLRPHETAGFVTTPAR